MRQDKSLLIAAVLACVLPLATTAATPMSATELHGYCLAHRADPDSAASRICAAYVRGFLEGSVKAEGHTRTPAFTAESWLERARRTRLGPRNSTRAVYCIDADISAAQIIEQLLLHADTHPPRVDTPASAMLLATLRRLRAC
jgi:hypothetical protein